MSSLIGILVAIIAYLFYQNKKLKGKVLDTELKNDKEKLYDAQKKTDSARDRFLALLDKYRKGE